MEKITAALDQSVIQCVGKMVDKERAARHYPAMAAEALAMVKDADLAVRRAMYVSALITHDWQFQFSDDHSTYVRGAAERQALCAMQATIDPLFRIWNRHAPVDFRRVPA